MCQGKSPIVSPVPGPCSITLFSEEYYLGEKIVFSENVEDLKVWDWQEKLHSVSVEGSCSWKIFTGEHFTGDFEVFTATETYLDINSVGQVYIDAKSMRRI